MSEFYVYRDGYIGKCYWTEKRARVSSMFSYDSAYLKNHENWNIDPALSLVEGAQAVGFGLPGAFRDAAPDRWGRNLIRHRYAKETEGQHRKMRALGEVDYLLGVSDFSRQGDLRFALRSGGTFEHPSNEIPKLIALPKLLRSAHTYDANQDAASLSYLLDAGSASLGGARPKASVMDGDRLLIAKFPHRHDDVDVMAWEYVSLLMAKDAGIRVPDCRLEKIDGQHVLLLARFDREAYRRIGYISAMTLLERSDGAEGDYTEIALRIRDVSVRARDDLHELFRRIVFSILINNTDDHLRNHGFLREGSGWRLSPVFDVNPNPDSAAVRVTGICGERAREPSLAALLANAKDFDLSFEQATYIASEVSDVAASFQTYANTVGIPATEQARFHTVIRPVGDC